jgi:dTDP-4-dehydrorhamnose 3,5-epimerase
MRVTSAGIADVLVIDHDVHRDGRGFFYETFNERVFAAAVADVRFVQDNRSRSHRHVLRGLHYQVLEAQGKFVSVAAGEIFDVAVDLRRSSPDFGRWTAVRLAGDSGRSLWIPPGFAHGFLVLSELAEVSYKTTAYWAPQHERCIVWNDPDLGIDWPLSGEPILSPRDAVATRLRDAEVYESGT